MKSSLAVSATYIYIEREREREIERDTLYVC